MLSAFRGLFSANAGPRFPIQSLSSDQYVIGDLIELQNGLILIIGYFDNGIERKEDKLNLCLYDPKLGKILKDRTIDWDSGSRHISPISPELFVLYDSYSDFKIFNAHTLSDEGLIKRKLVQESYSYTQLNANQFMSIKESGKERFILLHDHRTKQFNQIMSPPIKIEKEAYLGNDGYKFCHAGQLTCLGNNQFAVSVTGHNTGYFKVYLFKLDPDNKEKLKLNGIISPRPAPHNLSQSSWGNGKFIVLPQERILTFNTYFRYFEVWKGTERSDYWEWDQPDISDIAPLPDGEHLLMMESGTAVHLFNLKTKILQPIDIGKLQPWRLMVNMQGQAIIRACDKDNKTKILIIDLQKKLLNSKPLNSRESKDDDSRYIVIDITEAPQNKR